MRTAEDMLRLMPQSMRHGSAGARARSPGARITSIVYPAARSGLLTGVLLALARMSAARPRRCCSRR